MTIKISIIEDHPLMLKAIVQELTAHADLQVVGTSPHGAELLHLVQRCTPDVVILDLRMSTGVFEPVEAIQALRRAYPRVQVLVLTGYDDGIWVRDLIAAGAHGYVLKSDNLSLCLPEAVRAVHRGGRFYSPGVAEKYLISQQNPLSPQEAAILRLVAQGFSNSRIGQQLGLSEKTVRNSLSIIYSKLDLRGDEDIHLRVAAINKAKDMGALE